MKLSRWPVLGSALNLIKYALIVMLLLVGTSELNLTPAYAQGANGAIYNGSFPNGLGAGFERSFKGYGSATANQTFATTSYAALAGATVAVTPKLYDPTTPASSLLEVRWSADVTKATATTGTCAVVYNGGTPIAASARTTSSAAGQNSIGGQYVFPENTQGAVTVSLSCKSGDTNTLTVANAQIVVDELVYYAPTNP